MILFPTLSPEEINLITVKEQRISDKLKKKKKAQPWESIYCKYNLPCNAGESKVRRVHCCMTKTKTTGCTHYSVNSPMCFYLVIIKLPNLILQNNVVFFFSQFLVENTYTHSK